MRERENERKIESHTGKRKPKYKENKVKVGKVEEGGVNVKHNITGVARTVFLCANNTVIFTLNRGSIITTFTKTVENIRWYTVILAAVNERKHYEVKWRKKSPIK